MLEPYRVLDLTEGRAALGPMILGDLGADVIRVEPKGGGVSREEAPLDPLGAPGLRSLPYRLFNRNKRALALDLESAAGREQFLALAAGTDFLFESGAPGAMAARGLGYDVLARVNPALVYVAISPFGQDGPYAQHLATDLTLAAMGGMVAVNGEPDRPPVRITVPQAWYHAAAESAVAALVAHRRMLTTGKPQFADVSVQASVFWTGLNSMIAHAIQGRDMERAGTMLQLGTISLPMVYGCSDGEVVLIANGSTMPGLVPWMVEEGVVPGEWIEREEWKTYDVRWLQNLPTTYTYDEVMERIAAYTDRHTKAELFTRALAENVSIAPVNTVADVLAFSHLEQRRYWQAMDLGGGRTVRAPGPFVRITEHPISYRRPAPAPGEHDREILGEASRSPAKKPAAPRRDLPFEGLKVADFSWIGVGPITAKYLADHGATTVRVETANPPDRLRVAGPFKDAQPGTNRSQFFGAFNTSKLSLSLNLKVREAVAVARQLIAWADVLIESFTPGTLAGFGLTPAAIRELNPGIITVSSCLMGQTGPAAAMAGYGNHAAAISGFYQVTGWPDRDPGGPFVAYTDTIAPHFLGAALLAALDHRARTGEGVSIEQAQMESALYFLGPELLDHQVSGRVPRRNGNVEEGVAPHGVYPCAGDDEWCAIAAETDAQWQALVAALGRPGWAADPALATAAGRWAAREAIDRALGEWTRTLSPHEAMGRLQAAGVPAGAVQRSSDLLTDPQLAHRHFFRPLAHGEMGVVPYEGHQFRIAGYDSGPRFASPCLGEHSVQVMQEILGMSEEGIGEVLASGAIA